MKSTSLSVITRLRYCSFASTPGSVAESLLERKSFL